MGVLLLVLSTLVNSGCGLISQAIYGFTHEETVRGQKVHSLRVEASQEGAEIYRTDMDGTKKVGHSPLTDTPVFEVDERTQSNRSRWPALTGLAVDLGGTAAGMYALGKSDNVLTVGLGITGLALYGTFALVADIVAAAWSAGDGKLLETQVVGEGTEVTYQAKFESREVTKTVRVPSIGTRLKLELPATANLAEVAEVEPVSTTRTMPGPRVESDAIIAVMEVENPRATSVDKDLSADLFRNVTDQLRVFLASHGYRTIDRGAQDAALKGLVKSMKKDSYKSCYAETCQIDLGKALAATHILRARAARFDKVCVLNAEVVHLEREVTVLATSAKGACTAESFYTLSDQVTQDIAKNAAQLSR